MDSESTRLLLAGKHAFEKALDSTDIAFIHRLTEFYRKTLDWTEDGSEDQIFTQKNLAVVHWLLANKQVLKGDPADHTAASVALRLSDAVDSYVQAANMLLKALSFDRRSDKPIPGLRQRIHANLKQLVQDAVTAVENSTKPSEVREKNLLKLLDVNLSRRSKYLLWLALAKNYYECGAAAIDAKDYAEALKYFRLCEQPLKEVEEAMSAYPCIENNAELESLAGELNIEILQSVASAYIVVEQADTKTEHFKRKGNQALEDGITDVLTSLQEAINSLHFTLDDGDESKTSETVGCSRPQCKNCNLEIEAIMWSKCGTIYHEILKNEQKAREAYTSCVKLCQNLLPNHVIGQAWYKIAVGVLDGLKKNEQEEVELATIQSLKDKSVESILCILCKDFPLLHAAPNGFNTFLTDNDVKGLPRNEVKKLLQRFLVAYHPDRVNQEQHGRKYYLLCQEITKLLAAKYESYKTIAVV